MRTSIDINCDLGESFGCYTYGHDAEMFPYISSANVACGFHAGDATIMNDTVRVAKAQRVHVGAHIGFPDRLGFGRRNIQVAPQHLQDYTTYQLGALAGFVNAHEMKLHHVKAHGAFYMMALEDAAMANALVEATAIFDDELMIYTIKGSATWEAAQAKGIRVVSEFFADRPYYKDGSVKMFDWTLEEAGGSPESLALRVIQMITRGEIQTHDGGSLALSAETVCIHSDTPGAPEIIKALVKALSEARILVRSPA